MANRSQHRLWRWLGTNLCRLLLSVTFVFSGVVKLIDPRGTQYKIEDYATLFGLGDYLSSLLALVGAVALAMLEFYLGFNLFFSIRRRTTTRLTLALMLVLTPLTLVLALHGGNIDCGCFGDALRLTPWQTFGKNVVLLLATLVVVPSYRRLTRFISERNQWMLSLYALIFALFLAIYNIRTLPVMDFRPYHIGADLPKAIEAEWNGQSDEMRYIDFSIQSAEGEDITLQWLGRPGYKFLLVAPFLEQADDSAMDRINALYDYSVQYGYPFLCLTSSMEEAQERWRDQTGGEYPFALTDGVVLKTMIRSNPGLILLHDGVVYNKWSVNNLPSERLLTTPLEQQTIGQMQKTGRIRALYRLLLWFTLPLLLLTLIDRIWVGKKLYRRRQIHRQINANT
ncbi:MAG: DoxX family protein [Bacteroidaceae bacterium]|nr:DoxX family protein [Bacteroidaceae bacterium]